MRKIIIENKNIPIDTGVATVFDSYPPEVVPKLMFLRQLIFDTAASIEGIGQIEETLRRASRRSRHRR